mgnify:CR=1 FL=1
MARWVSYIDNSVGDGANTIAGIISNGPTYGIGISSDVYITGLSTFGNTSRFTNTVRLDGQLRDGDNAFGSSGQVLSSDGTDTRWINAGELSAGAASQVAVNDDSNTNAERFITIVDAASGNNNVKTDASLKYNPSTNTITTVNITGNVTGNVTGNASGSSGSCTGNAASATTLQNTRTIGGVSFNGSSNINLPGVNQAGNQNTSGNAGSATILANTRTIGGVSFNGSANINLPGVNQAGNQNTSGNAATATVLETTRNFSISGEITANAQSFNGSGNLTLSATVDNEVIDEANLKVSNAPSDGYFLQAQSGDTGGLRWSQVTLPSSNTLSGTTLASGITASSITSLGTLTGLSVNGNVSVTGTVDGRDVSSDGSKLDGIDSGAKDDQTKSEIDALNINADQLDGQHGSYYQNAGNLNAGTIPDARLDDSSLFVTGMIMMYTGNSAPSGWAICNGSSGTPDLRDRFIVGAGSGYSVNDTGGAASVTLSTAQIPSHNHSFSGSSSHSHTINQHTHSFSGSGSNTHSHGVPKGRGGSQADISHHVADTSVEQTQGTFATTNTTISISVSGTTGGASDRGTNSQTVSISGNTGNKGDGGSHENRPPYYALMFIMKL